MPIAGWPGRPVAGYEWKRHMPRTAWITVLTALIFTFAGLMLLKVILQPSGPPLVAGSFQLSNITPNADGVDDATPISYALRRPSLVSIYFIDQLGNQHYFRRNVPRDAGTYEVEFSGVVEPYTLPGEQLVGQLQARMLQNGAYTWVIEATDDSGGLGRISGTLTIADADTTLPELRNLTVSPSEFSPNQDGIEDRATINVYLTKDVAANGLQVYLLDNKNVQYSIAEASTSQVAGKAGLHEYSYDGGIDLGLVPPPDGTYVVTAQVEDRVGQKLVVTNTVSIRGGGLPQAQILLGQVQWSAKSVVIRHTLAFTLTVDNYGSAALRTSGPWSGAVYPSMDSNYNALGSPVQAGVWRVGIHCETCLNDYPWRWGLGTLQDLSVIPDKAGNPQYYLLPGHRATVTGAIVLDKIVSARNPQYFWAGLIHEDVGISSVNNHVMPDFVTILHP